MLLTRSTKSDPQPLPVVTGSAVHNDAAPMMTPTSLHGDSCPWPRAETEHAEYSDRPARRREEPWDVVEEWGWGSFPASDPPANW